MTIRCSRCILPETIPNISFNDKGVCNNCLEFEKSDRQKDYNFDMMHDKFFEIIEKAKQRALENNSKYDVLVPVSGGRDSSYLAWKLATEYKLRVLCVNYSNPYTSTQAAKNVEALAKTIGADLVGFRYPRRIHERSFKANLKAWIKKPNLASLGLICIACKPMYLEFYKIAHKHKIGLIIDGSNIFEVTTFKMEAQGGKGTKNLFSLKTFMNYLIKILGNLRYIKLCNAGPAFKTFLSLNGLTPYLKFRYPDVNKFGYFYFFPYNELEINKALDMIGWKKAEDNKSPWRFDCEIDSVKNYIYDKVIGATEKDDLFSKNIRYGLMTRDEALKRLNEGEVNTGTVDRILNGAGISRADLDRACLMIKNRD